MSAHVITRTDTAGKIAANCTCGDGIQATTNSMSAIPADVQVAIWVQKHTRNHRGATVQ